MSDRYGSQEPSRRCFTAEFSGVPAYTPIIALDNRLTKAMSDITKCHRERGFRALIRYPVVRQESETPDDAIQLIAKWKKLSPRTVSAGAY